MAKKKADLSSRLNERHATARYANDEYEDDGFSPDSERKRYVPNRQGQYPRDRYRDSWRGENNRQQSGWNANHQRDNRQTDQGFRQSEYEQRPDASTDTAQTEKLRGFAWKQKKKQERVNPQANPEPVKTDEENEMDFLAEMQAETMREKKRQRRVKVTSGILVAVICYVVFLIYGVIMTTYQYGSDGAIHPQMMTVSDIQEEKDYETIMVWYERTRVLYERILMLDYRLGAGSEDPLTIGPEYNALLEDSKDVNVSDLAIKNDALTVNTKYSTVKDMMYQWVSNDAALYLQYMSNAITKNDSEAADNAIVEKDTMYNDFSLITQNIVTLGENIKGVDITEITDWSPDGYVNEQVYGSADGENKQSETDNTGTNTDADTGENKSKNSDGLDLSGILDGTSGNGTGG